MSGSRSHCEVGLCNQRRKNVRFFNTVWPTIESSRFKDFRLKKQVLQPRPKTLYVVLHVTRAELGMPSDRSRDQRGLRPRPHLCKASDLRRVGHDPDIAPLSGVSSSRLTACLGGVSVLRCGWERMCGASDGRGMRSEVSRNEGSTVGRLLASLPSDGKGRKCVPAM